ncbi:MAG: helix-turn-helix transcriptional regulator [Actinobacteria bacterium]|nr:MAG: helix-turn-helix transcriptional regulator [Actinomycetota bacterium]
MPWAPMSTRGSRRLVLDAALLQRAREAAGLSQQQAATAARMSLRQYGKYERAEGSPNPRLATLGQVADAVSADPGELLTWSSDGSA